MAFNSFPKWFVGKYDVNFKVLKLNSQRLLGFSRDYYKTTKWPTSFLNLLHRVEEKSEVH